MWRDRVSETSNVNHSCHRLMGRSLRHQNERISVLINDIAAVNEGATPCCVIIRTESVELAEQNLPVSFVFCVISHDGSPAVGRRCELVAGARAAAAPREDGEW